MVSITGSVARGVYSAAMATVTPLLPLYLRRRQKKGKEDPSRLGERYGKSTYPRPEGTLLWIHGASVGETLSALPLVHTLLKLNPHLHILVTSGTMTSAALLADRLPSRALHQFIPLDTKPAVQAFLDHWQPNLVFWLESELWPHMLGAIKSRKIPAVLLNARLSEKSARHWRWCKGLMREMLATFSLVLAQNNADALRLRRFIGEDKLIQNAEKKAVLAVQKGKELPPPPALRVRQVGNLKFTAPALMGSPDGLSQLLATSGTRPRWIMASTHEGEEAIAARVHQQLIQRWPELLTIIVPRHPERAPVILSELNALGVAPQSIAQRSLGLLPHRDTEIYLADTMGELGTLYGAAPIACVGGSFTPKGGHNPIEPAQCGCAVIAGPDMSNFCDIAASMMEVGALTQVSDVQALADEVARLIADYPLLTRRQDIAQKTTNQQTRVLANILKELESLLASAGLSSASYANGKML